MSDPSTYPLLLVHQHHGTMCDDCAGEMPGMKHTGGYTYDGGRWYSGCDHQEHRHTFTVADATRADVHGPQGDTTTEFQVIAAAPAARETIDPIITPTLEAAVDAKMDAEQTHGEAFEIRVRQTFTTVWTSVDVQANAT